MTITSQNYRRVVLFSILAIVPLLLISNSFTSYGQTNTTTTANQTSTNDGPNSESIKLIDSGIVLIKSGDNEGAKKSLLQAEAGLEDKPNLSAAEKHIEASLQALKDNDKNGALTHAEEAKKGLA
ncbi:MAG TPA: hypothetical protein VJU13_01810 [Candidatus Nitrosocosmicus sp.]|jgi:hypothetical protein|nr:hypothetical protein [Candidatus Nitrosocosmicus sp.]